MFIPKMTDLDRFSIVIALSVTLYVYRAINPHEKDTDEYQSLRLCRIGLALLAWSFGSGLLGFAFVITTFVLAIIGIIKGRTTYGIMLIIGSVAIPVLSICNTISSFTSP